MTEKENKTGRGKKKRATKAQMRVRRQRLEELLVMGRRPADIVEIMLEEFQVGEHQVEKMTTEIYAAWKAEERDNVEKKRAAQERRLLLYIRQAEKIRDKARCESIYSKIVGTEAPRKIAGEDGGPVKIVCEVVDYRAPEPAPQKKR